MSNNALRYIRRLDKTDELREFNNMKYSVILKSVNCFECQLSHKLYSSYIVDNQNFCSDRCIHRYLMFTYEVFE